MGRIALPSRPKPLLSPVPSKTLAAITAAAVMGRCPTCEAQLPEPHPRFCHA